MMSAPQVLEMSDLFASVLFYGGLFGAVITGIYMAYDKFGFPLPAIGKKYIPLRDAALKYRDQCLENGNTIIEVLADTDLLNGSDLSMQYYAEHILGDSTVWGRRKNTKVWEEINKDQRKQHPRCTVTEDGKGLMYGSNVIYPEARMLKSDLKKRLKDLKEYDQQKRHQKA